MSAMFDFIVGKKRGKVAELEASLEHTAGYLGVEIEEAAATRRAFLAHLQAENSCPVTGAACREWTKCGCHLEMAAAVDAHR